MSKAFPYLIFALLVACCFTFGTVLQPLTHHWIRQDVSGSIFKALLGDGRRLFANHFFVKADVSFHGGYYPSIFDRVPGPKDTRHLTRKEEHDAHDAHDSHDEGEHSAGTQGESASGPKTASVSHPEHDAEEEHEKAMAFLDRPKDWIERFGRHFMITEHTHLQGGKEREILPWLKISADLDPQRPDTYTVASYWLRDLGKFKEAEAFLREGLRNNPDSYEIYFEYGRLCFEDYKDIQRARNLWELALRKWNASQGSSKDPDLMALDQIAVHLAHLEEGEKNYQRAIELFRLALKATPYPDVLQAQILELEKKASAVKP